MKFALHQHLLIVKTAAAFFVCLGAFGPLGAPAAAQVTFSTTDLPQGDGDFTRAYANTSEANVSALIGSKGGPQRWDFSRPKEAGEDVFRIDIVTPDDGGQAASFPAAAYAQRTTRESSGKQSWEYYRILPGQGRAYFGFYDPVANSADPLTVFEFPTIDLPEEIQFGQSWQREVDWIDVLDLGFIRIESAVHFESHAEVDAYGTVVLPELGEFPALRVNEINSYETTDLTLGLPLGTQFFRNYYWLVPGIGKAVHLISKAETAPPPENFTTAATVLRVFEANGIASEPELLPVVDLKASLKGKELFLSWQSVAGGAGYRIETVRDVGSADWQTLAETTDNFWFDPDPPVESIRLYRVWARP